MAKLRLTDRNKGKVDKNGKKKKPNWQWRFEITVNGQKQNFSKSGFATKKEAEEAGTAALAEYQGGGYVKPKDIVLTGSIANTSGSSPNGSFPALIYSFIIVSFSHSNSFLFK